MPSVARWAAAFVLTVLVETPIVAVAVRGQGRTLARGAGLALLANAITHPALVRLLPRLMRLDLPTLLVAEAAVVVVEAALYARGVPVSAGRALAVSLLANAASFAIGALATRATGWP